MANEPGKTETVPFLKWAGGKGQLLKQYDSFFPQTSIRNYFEPFLGSGAVFFHLRGRGMFQNYHLSESNPELMNCYRVVRDHVEDLIILLADHKARHSTEHYYAVRDQDRAGHWLDTPAVERAARMIYLNRTCYNGLWRVNSSGNFNVPVGRYKNPHILNEDRLRAASRALQGVALAVADFEVVIRRAGRGDFVYLDPPYVPISPTSSFTSYSPDAFGEYQHRKLALVFGELNRKGCRVLLSNSDTPLVHELYQKYRFERVTARRAINSAKALRGQISEFVILNY